MLGSFRKFKSSIFAKIFLIIVAVPFIFWGMGPVFQGAKLTSIVTIGDNKISADKFVQYLKRLPDKNNITFNKKKIEKLFSKYIGEQLVKYEMNELKLNISETSLAKIIRNEKIFQKDNIFLRTRYEKFLIENSISAKTFENNILNHEKKNQFFEFIGGGVLPPQFLININYQTSNQKRFVQLIDLNKISKENINFTSKEIKNFYNQNKINYNQIYKTVKFINLTPKTLVGENDFNSLFFEKIDEIEDLIVEGQDLNFLSKKYNLEKINILTIDSKGKNKELKKINILKKDLINKIFTQDESEKTFIVQNDENYLIIEIINTDNTQKNIDDVVVQQDIKDKLTTEYKRKLISEIITKINNNKFSKKNFDEFANNKKITIKEIKLNSLNDNQILKETIVKQIYKHPSKKVILAGSNNLEEIFLIYIDKVENISLNQNSEKLKEYLVTSKVSLINSLYDTYDIYLKNKYPIEINYKVLDNIKDYFE